MDDNFQSLIQIWIDKVNNEINALQKSYLFIPDTHCLFEKKVGQVLLPDDRSLTSV